MGITGKIKDISASTLKLLREDPPLVKAFFDAQWLPESAFWLTKTYWSEESSDKYKQEARKRFGSNHHGKKSYDWQVLEKEFLAEWETPDLDLDKCWEDITFLLAGYVPVDINSECTLPELNVSQKKGNDFFPFLVIENSTWDGLPLVNAFGAGTAIGYQTSYSPVRYLIPSEVEQILDGLLRLTREGYKHRFIQESQKPEPCPFIDWSYAEEMVDDMVDFYDQILDYYRNAVSQNKALLLYLT